MMRFKTFIAICCLYCTAVHGQEDEKKRNLNPFLVYDNYFTFIGDKSADVWGFRGGLEWNETWRFGAGYNKIKSDIIEYKVLSGEELNYAKNDTVKAQLYLSYYPLMAEYIFYRSEHWILSFPLQAGYGRSYFQYFDKNDEKRKIYDHGIVVTIAGVGAQYKILKWVGIGAGFGYRLMIINNPDIDTKMNAPVFAIGVKIYLDAVIKTLRGKD